MGESVFECYRSPALGSRRTAGWATPAGRALGANRTVRVFLDTSVLVAALTKSNPARLQVMPWLEGVRAKVHVGLVASHSLAELYSVLDSLSERGLVGGETYDALLLQAAKKAEADQILTLNERHVRRVLPELADRIAAP